MVQTHQFLVLYLRSLSPHQFMVHSMVHNMGVPNVAPSKTQVTVGARKGRSVLYVHALGWALIRTMLVTVGLILTVKPTSPRFGTGDYKLC